MTDFASKYSFAFEDSDEDSKPSDPTNALSTTQNNGSDNIIKWQSAEKESLSSEKASLFDSSLKEGESNQESDFLTMIQNSDKSDLKIYQRPQQQYQHPPKPLVATQAQNPQYPAPAESYQASQAAPSMSNDLFQQEIPSKQEEQAYHQQELKQDPSQKQTWQPQPNVTSSLERAQVSAPRQEAPGFLKNPLQEEAVNQNLTVKKEPTTKTRDWLKGKDDKVSKFFQDLLSDSDLSEEEIGKKILPTKEEPKPECQTKQSPKPSPPKVESLAQTITPHVLVDQQITETAQHVSPFQNQEEQEEQVQAPEQQQEIKEQRQAFSSVQQEEQLQELGQKEDQPYIWGNVQDQQAEDYQQMQTTQAFFEQPYQQKNPYEQVDPYQRTSKEALEEKQIAMEQMQHNSNNLNANEHFYQYEDVNDASQQVLTINHELENQQQFHNYQQQEQPPNEHQDQFYQPVQPQGQDYQQYQWDPHQQNQERALQQEQQEPFNNYQEQKATYQSSVREASQLQENSLASEQPTYSEAFYDQVEIQLKPFQEAFQISDVQAVNWTEQQQEQHQPHYKQQIGVQLLKSVNGDRQEHPQRKNFVQFYNSKPKLLIGTSQQEGQVSIGAYTIGQNIKLVKSIGDLVSVEPQRFSEHLKGKMVQGIEEYLACLPHDSPEGDVWVLLQSLINITQPNQRRQAPSVLQPNNFYLQGQRNLLIEQLCRGQPLSSFIQDLHLKKDIEEPNNQAALQSLNLGAAFDYDKGIQYEGFVPELIRRGHWSDALMFSSFFCSEKTRDQFFGEYIKKYYSPKNPLYTLLMLLTYQGNSILQEPDVEERILSEWRIHVAFLLKHIEFVPSRVGDISQFLDQLGSQLLLKKQDLWGYVFLKLLVGNWGLSDLSTSEMSSRKMDLSLNYVQSIIEILSPSESSERSRVELSFYRTVIYNQVMGLHEKANDELTFVIEKRNSLDRRLTQSQYFNFILREMKSNLVELLRGQTRTEPISEFPLSKPPKTLPIAKYSPSGQKECTRPSSGSIKKSEHRPEEQAFSPPQHDQRLNEHNQHEEANAGVSQGLMTGFKGLFKKVITQASSFNQKNMLGGDQQDRQQPHETPEQNDYATQQQAVFTPTVHETQIQKDIVQPLPSEQPQQQDQIMRQLSPVAQTNQQQIEVKVSQSVQSQVQGTPQAPPPQVRMQAPPRFGAPPRMMRPPPPRGAFNPQTRQQPPLYQQVPAFKPANGAQSSEQTPEKVENGSQQTKMQQQLPSEQPLKKESAQGSSGMSNPFAMPRTANQQPSAGQRGAKPRAFQGRNMYASLLHHQEDTQKAAENTLTSKPPPQ